MLLHVIGDILFAVGTIFFSLALAFLVFILWILGY